MDRIGIDIGGSLAKISWISESETQVERGFVAEKSLDENVLHSLHEILTQINPESQPVEIPFARTHIFPTPSKENNAPLRLHLKSIPTNAFPSFLLELQKHLRSTSAALIRTVSVTGGGSRKYEEELGHCFQKENIQHQDEIQAFSSGLDFMVSLSKQKPAFADRDTYLSVCIGTGTSIIKREGHKSQRVGGSLIGGGTFYGTARQFSGLSDFSQILELGKKGNHLRTDTLVRDIYGDAYGNVLGGDLVASSFAKSSATSEPADLIQSSMFMMGATFSQLATLYHNQCFPQVSDDVIVFAGGFLCQNPFAQEAITQTLEYWGSTLKRNLKPVFPTAHFSIDFSGSIGCLLLGTK